MIHREISSEVLLAAKKMPVICVTGPRQSGKTTLVKNLFSEYQYYNLEFPEHRTFAQEDPAGFLSGIDQGIIIDEIQQVPELLSSIQYYADEKKLNGRIIITGSQNILLMQSVSQTLAGRVALFTLLPLSVTELERTTYAEKEYENYLVKSMYPRIYDQELKADQWIQDYISTYVERDVRQIVSVKDLSLFSNFIKLCAGHTGQQVNYSTLSNNLGVDVHTIKSWLSILETSYIIFLQQPWYKNLNKRLIKAQRLYFYDAGIACNLLGIKSVDNYSNHYLKGGLFESFIVSELLKYNFNHRKAAQFHYLRDSNDNEVDLMLELAGKIKAVEIKAGKTINSDFFKGFKYLDKHLEKLDRDYFLIYGGSHGQNRTGVKVLSWRDYQEVFGCD